MRMHMRRKRACPVSAASPISASQALPAACWHRASHLQPDIDAEMPGPAGHRPGSAQVGALTCAGVWKKERNSMLAGWLYDHYTIAAWSAGSCIIPPLCNTPSLGVLACQAVPSIPPTAHTYASSIRPNKHATEASPAGMYLLSYVPALRETRKCVKPGCKSLRYTLVPGFQ